MLHQYKGKWEEGKCTEGQYVFADGLKYESQDWEYCDGYDRRFYTEVHSVSLPTYGGCIYVYIYNILHIFGSILMMVTTYWLTAA